MQRAKSLEKAPMLGRTEGRRRRGQQRMSQLDGITNSMDMNLGKLKEGEGQESPECYRPWDGEESDTTQRLNSNR